MVASGPAGVACYDLSGRPFALADDESTYRRALDGWLLEKRPASASSPRLRRRLPPAAGAPVLEAARREADALVGPLAEAPGLAEDVRAEAEERLRRIASMDAAALAVDAALFGAVYRRVGILPPDQYLALVLEATEGCSWNACGFCDFYRDVPFRVKTPAAFADHVRAVRAYFGPSLPLRRSVFLGAANALCVTPERLAPLLETVAREFPGMGIYSFVDAGTGHRRRVEDYRHYARLGLRRVYVGLETGDPELLAWLGKPGGPEDAVELIGLLHEAGIAACVIVLLGAGGERFAEAHLRATAEVLSRMRLGRQDLVYFSELVEGPDLSLTRRADAPDLRPLTAERSAAQCRAIAASFRPADPARPPRCSVYDIREFVY